MSRPKCTPPALQLPTKHSRASDASGVPAQGTLGIPRAAAAASRQAPPPEKATLQPSQGAGPNSNHLASPWVFLPGARKQVPSEP